MVLKSKTLTKVSKRFMILGLFGLILYSYVVQTTWIAELLRSNEELCTHTQKKLIWIYRVEQSDLELLKKFGSHVNVNLSKVFLKACDD